MVYFPPKHSWYSIIFTFTKTGLVKCKKRECVNYSTNGVCGYMIAGRAYTSSLTLFLQSLPEDLHSVDLLELSNWKSKGLRNKERLQKSAIKKYFW